MSTCLRSAPTSVASNHDLRLVGPCSLVPAVFPGGDSEGQPPTLEHGPDSPGKGGPALPVPAGDQRVERVDVPGGELARGASRLDRRRPQHAGPDRGGRGRGRARPPAPPPGARPPPAGRGPAAPGPPAR